MRGPSREELPPGCWDGDLDAHPADAYDWIDPGTDIACRIERDPLTWTYRGYVTSAGHRNGTVGFDTYHRILGDRSPSGGDDDAASYHYWTFDEVKKQVERMADQCFAMGK